MSEGAVIAGEPLQEGVADPLRVELPRAPQARVLWSRTLVVAWILLVVFLFDQLTILLYDLWLLDALGLDSVFWTNFRTGAALFGIAVAVFAGAIALPAFVHRVPPSWRGLLVQGGLFVGLIAGYLLSLRKQEARGVEVEAPE